MSSSFGGTVKLTGESEYRKALNNITDNLRVLSSEMKVVTSQYDKNDKSVSNLSQQNSVLTKKIDEQKQKVNTLKDALASAKKETGENSTTTKKWQTDLNNAQAELNKLEHELANNKNEIKNFGKAEVEAGEKSTRLGDIIKGNLISSAIIGGIKALGNVMKEVGSTLINVGKQALSSYADYEQLVGGVETLFKDNASTVENYANNAYKTAGLSANDYMETVTSFSASLLQSLKGDTAKSAEVADMAITDMSDNANKMGTDMSMIQNAYQGFAKQNYTMLDNLKLGYGGTKTEMERLLSDAQKVTGIKYDINNLNDVYQAIHVIQGELGITGTTAKEASTTIQGSVSAMKSAWQNMLTGIATGNTGNMGNLVKNLADSVITAAQNILPRVQEIASGIVDVLPQIIEQINTNLPMLLNSGVQILNTLMQGIITNLPAIMESANQIINTLINTLIKMLPQIIDGGIQIIVALTQGLAEQLPTLVPQIIETVITITNSLLDNIDMVIDAGIQLLLALADGLIEALPQLIEKAPVIIQKLFDAFVRNFPKIVKAGGELIGKLVAGITGSFWKLLEVAPKLISNIVKGLSAGWSEMQNTGKYLIEGLWDGIKGMASWVTDKIKGFATNILDNMKEALGIHSPSTLFRDEVGKNIALGVGEGFSSTMKDVSQEMANSIPTEFDINSALNTTNNSNSLTLENLTGAFIKGVKNLNAQIIIDKDVAGRFIITSVNSRLGEVV